MADNDTIDRSEDAVSEEYEAEQSEDSGGASSGGGAASRRAREMNLDELRTEIRSIDREIIELIAQRTYVAESIAEVKRQRGMPTTDESQETAVMERAGENARQFDLDANLVKAIFRLLIELNKIEQNQHAINDGQQSNWDSDEG